MRWFIIFLSKLASRKVCWFFESKDLHEKFTIERLKKYSNFNFDFWFKKIDNPWFEWGVILESVNYVNQFLAAFQSCAPYFRWCSFEKHRINRSQSVQIHSVPLFQYQNAVNYPQKMIDQFYSPYQTNNSLYAIFSSVIFFLIVFSTKTNDMSALVSAYSTSSRSTIHREFRMKFKLHPTNRWTASSTTRLNDEKDNNNNNKTMDTWIFCARALEQFKISISV